MQEGTGLGLTISRQFARMMGGEITVSSDLGQGSLFQFDIPVTLPEPSEIQSLKSRVKNRVIGLEPGQPVYRLLVVEDVEANRQLLVNLLKPLGFEVREASNGQEAVAVWQQWQPHLIWMDMRMPVMDGYEATRRIKAGPQEQSTIIIAVTASAFKEDREQILAAGCDDFVRKPVRAEEIVDRLTKYLGVRFVYQEIAVGQPREPGSIGLEDSLDLAGLPADWLADLRQAVIETDIEKITLLAAGISDRRPVLANALLKLVGNFDYEPILIALSQLNE